MLRYFSRGGIEDDEFMGDAGRRDQLIRGRYEAVGEMPDSCGGEPKIIGGCSEGKTQAKCE